MIFGSRFESKDGCLTVGADNVDSVFVAGIVELKYKLDCIGDVMSKVANGDLNRRPFAPRVEVDAGERKTAFEPVIVDDVVIPFKNAESSQPAGILFVEKP